MKHVVAIDQGTTGTTVLVIDQELRVVGRASEEFRQIYPQPGWVEHDPEDIWASVTSTLEGAMHDAGIGGDDVVAIGITNQRETTVLWERGTGKAPRNAIVWQDRRTSDYCAQLESQGKGPFIRERTGLLIDPYFSGSKLRWMLEEDPKLAGRAADGEIAFGTVDSFLVWRLSGGAAHVTDVTNASRTLLFAIRSLQWDDELLSLFGVPRAMLPEVESSSQVYAETRGVPGLPDGIPIAGIAGDQQAALFGQACFTPGDTKCTYGTGAFILMNTGTEPVKSDSGLLTTIAWQVGDGEVEYALEGSAFIAGAVVQWLRDGLGIIETAPQVEELARSVEDTGGVVFVPAFAGLGAPHWRPGARAAISGMTRGTTAAHIARAALEGMALQNYDMVKAMERDSGHSLTIFKVDGGASANDLLMQMQSDVLGTRISRPEVLETTAQGAAFLAGLATGVWAGKDQIADAWREQKRFEPTSDRSAVSEKLRRWDEAVRKA